MKKKVTNEEIKDVLNSVSAEIKRELDYDFRVAQSQMWIAENDLINSLNEEQKQLYDAFNQKRKAFYNIASELFERKY